MQNKKEGVKRPVIDYLMSMAVRRQKPELQKCCKGTAIHMRKGGGKNLNQNQPTCVDSYFC